MGAGGNAAAAKLRPCFPYPGSKSRAMAGQLEQARTAMTSLRELYPLPRVSKLEELFPLRRSEDIARWAEGLRKAGLPE